jgi:hypothetical protein
MAMQKPLVIVKGQVQQLPAGDTTFYVFPMLTSLAGNKDVCYTNEIMTALPPVFGTLSQGEIMLDLAGNVMTAQIPTTQRVPDFLTALDGDIMMGIGA